MFFKVFMLLLLVVFGFIVNGWLGILVSAGVLGYSIYLYIPSFYAIKGNKEFYNKNDKKALEWYGKAYNTKRGSVNLKNSYAMLLARTGYFDKSESVLNEIILDKTIKKEKKTPAKQYRALVYFKQGKVEDALDEANELFETARSSIMYGLLGYLKLATNAPIAETLDFCLEAYDYNSDDRDIVDNLVLAYYKSGEYEKAKELVLELIEKNPTFVEAFYHGALVMEKLGEAEKCREYLEKVNDCRRTALTTVSEQEVEALKNKFGVN